MARRPRLHVPGGIYHVTLRGNHQQPIFFRDSDRCLLDGIVERSIERCNARIHAFCWMTNHIHLLVEISDMPLGKLMLRIGSGYARTVQLRLETSGHLFERRYHASLVNTDRYLLAAVRYLHRNPVEGGLARDPAQYRWSSHRAYLGRDHKPWLTRSLVMRVLATDRREADLAYRRLMAMSCDTVPEYPPVGAAPEMSSSARFGPLMQPAVRAPLEIPPAGTLDELVHECCRQFGVTRSQLTARGRSQNLKCARVWLGQQAVHRRIASICAVARLLERSEGAIRHAMNRQPVRDAGS